MVLKDPLPRHLLQDLMGARGSWIRQIALQNHIKEIAKEKQALGCQRLREKCLINKHVLFFILSHTYVFLFREKRREVKCWLCLQELTAKVSGKSLFFVIETLYTDKI